MDGFDTSTYLPHERTPFRDIYLGCFYIREDLVTSERSIVMNKLAKVTIPTFVPRGTTSRKSYLPPGGASELPNGNTGD